MASDRSFVEYVADQMNDAGEIAFRAMFGEYAIYCDGKVVALVCDDQLFVKPTPGGRALIAETGAVVEAPPYEGAKLSFLIDWLDDRDWLSELIHITVDELPQPKPKKPRAPRKKSGP